MGTALGYASPSPAGIPSPQGLGYSNVVLERLAQHARRVLAFSEAWIVVRVADEADEFAVVAGAGVDPDVIGRRLRAPELGAVAWATVLSGSEDRGALCVGGRDERRKLEPGEMELLEELGILAGEALSHHARRELASGDSEAEIRALVKALAEADGDTYDHSLEVAATATAVGRLLGLERTELIEVELGALLHDVGKLRVPPELLAKPGKLTPEERRVIRLHPEWGAEMVARIPGLEAVALIVRLHHERPDGGGYPHGITLERIPFASRIVSVCDAYGAMTKRRPYRMPLRIGAALRELEQHAGTQFDADVVGALTAFVRSHQRASA
ncbi:MAG TPA: HD domain-containing phosphohydrolase [Thermoleophilaceae bacterium]|jgi:putative nucleotidyltransferase with HDIG domain|nr:HD domain-containing phosphohydrolase [Thermoleophilaceae bacterium]